MKKLFVIILLIASVLLVSCSNTKSTADLPDGNETKQLSNESEDNASNDQTNSSANLSGAMYEEGGANGATYTIRLEDWREIVLGAYADDVLPALGDYVDMYEAPSCIHEGYDRIYTYDDFTITTAPNSNGDNIVTEFLFESTECAFENGIMIGSTVDELKSVYGEDCNESYGVVNYIIECVDASFTITDGRVTGILFMYIW